VLAGWCVAPFDQPPEVIWRSLVEVDPVRLVAVPTVEEVVQEWLDKADGAVERYLSELARFDSSPQVLGDPPDKDPPQLMSFSLEACLLEPTDAVEILGRAHITDSVAGVAGAGYNSSPSQARLRGPTGEQRDLMFSADGQRVSGSRFDGFYESTARLEPFDPEGTWTVEYVMVVDQAGHARSISPAELQAAGFADRIEVRRRR
jgi:hypothetical protein